MNSLTVVSSQTLPVLQAIHLALLKGTPDGWRCYPATFSLGLAVAASGNPIVRIRRVLLSGSGSAALVCSTLPAVLSPPSAASLAVSWLSVSSMQVSRIVLGCLLVDAMLNLYFLPAATTSRGEAGSQLRSAQMKEKDSTVETASREFNQSA
ncbi:hypothetical protein BJY04DRAFT_62907 [Aspergillus karnatakaensis]|uniref:uncharacterized protein n=1 Tax=Aspergillus karnatakaensis TaxID=1810916 RepID=UPI003CCE185A